mgnify:CR=1 FL=1
MFVSISIVTSINESNIGQISLEKSNSFISSKRDTIILIWDIRHAYNYISQLQNFLILNKQLFSWKRE